MNERNNKSWQHIYKELPEPFDRPTWRGLWCELRNAGITPLCALAEMSKAWYSLPTTLDWDQKFAATHEHIRRRIIMEATACQALKTR